MPSKNKGGRKKSSKKQKPPAFKHSEQVVPGSEEPETTVEPGSSSSSPPVGFDGSDCVTVPDSWEDLEAVPQPPEADSQSATVLTDVEVKGSEASAARFKGGAGILSSPSDRESSGELNAEDGIQEMEDELLAARPQHSNLESELDHDQRISSTNSDQYARVQEADFAKANSSISGADVIAGENERVLKEELNSVRGEYKSLQEDLAIYAEENRLLKAKIQEQSMRMADELSVATEAATNRERELEFFKDKYNESDARIKELEESKAAILATLPQQEKVLSELIVKNEDLTRENNLCIAQMQEQIDACDRLKEDNNALLSAMTAKDAATVENTSLIETLSLEVESLKIINAEMETRAAAGKELTDGYVEEIARLKKDSSNLKEPNEEVSNLESLLSAAKEETETVRNKLRAAVKKGKRIEQEKIALEGQVNGYLKEIDAAQSDLKSLEERVKAEKSELESQHSATLTELERKLTEANELLVASEANKEQLEFKLRAAVKKGMKIEQIGNELNAKVAELERVTSDNMIHIQALEKQIQEFQNLDFAGMQQRAAQAEELADKLTADMGFAQQALNAKCEELAEAVSLADGAKSDLARVSGELQSVEVENASLKVKCANVLECETRAGKAETQKAEMEEEMLGLRTKVSRARDAIEKMRQEKETLVVQVEELSESVSRLEIENADLQEICEMCQEPLRNADDTKPTVDPDLDDWVHRALHAEKRAAEAEAQRQKDFGILQDKVSAAERSSASSLEKIHQLESELQEYTSESSASKSALLTAGTRVKDLEAELMACQTELEELESMKAELAMQQQEIEHLKESSNPPSHGPNSIQEATSEIQTKIHSAHEAARCLATQMSLPFYESPESGEDGKLDAVRILLEGVGFGMQRQNLRMEEQLQHISKMANIQHELEAANSERERLTHEVAKYRRLSSGSIDAAGSLIETVPSALGQQQPAAKKRRDVHDIEAGAVALDIEEDEDNHRSEFLPLTAVGPLKNAPANAIYGLTLLDRGYLSMAKNLSGKPLMRAGIATYLIVFHILAFICFF